MIDNNFEPVCGVGADASWTATVKLKVPSADGVPLISPVADSAELPLLGDLACLGSSVSRSATVPTYGRRHIGAEDAVSSYDEEMVERLRSLGYLN